MKILSKINMILGPEEYFNEVKLNERSSPDDHYEKFFKKKLKSYGVKSPEELSKKKRKQFFDEIEKEWKE